MFRFTRTTEIESAGNEEFSHRLKSKSKLNGGSVENVFTRDRGSLMSTIVKQHGCKS